MRLNSSNGIAIIFFGPDGSGKTTQSILLKSYLVKRGYKVKRVWIRSNHSLAALISRIFIKLGYYKIVFSPEGNAYPVFDIKLLPKLKGVWSFIEFFSVLPWILLKVNFPLFFGYVVIADRYLIDTVVTLAYTFEDTNFLTGFIANILLRMMPQKTSYIHFDAEIEDILDRRKNENIKKDFIVFQKKWYRYFSSSFCALSVNTSKCKIQNTLNQIINYTLV